MSAHWGCWERATPWAGESGGWHARGPKISPRILVKKNWREACKPLLTWVRGLSKPFSSSCRGQSLQAAEAGEWSGFQLQLWLALGVVVKIPRQAETDLGCQLGTKNSILSSSPAGFALPCYITKEPVSSWASASPGLWLSLYSTVTFCTNLPTFVVIVGT